MKLIFATGNKSKMREAGEILGEDFNIIPAAEAGVTEDIPETGKTLRANSLQKAQYLYDRCGENCFADDTGLEVDILGGAPGVRTARYASDGHDNKANMRKLLYEMSRAEHEASMAKSLGLNVKTSRAARFRTVITLILDGKKHFFDGTVEGQISLCEKGNGGFGYDPVFIPDMIPSEDGTLVPNEKKLAFAEMSEEAKNAISHRGRALRAMAEFLRNNQ